MKKDDPHLGVVQREGGVDTSGDIRLECHFTGPPRTAGFSALRSGPLLDLINTIN